MTARALALVVAALACVVAIGACDGVTRPKPTVGEPITVGGGQFFPGDLPGALPADAGTAPPATSDGGADAGPVALAPLSVTSVQVSNLVAIPGGSLAFSGDVTSDAVAVGVRFADIGTGWWLTLAKEEDLTIPSGEPKQWTFSFSASFDAHAPPGHHPLRFVAIDGNGNAGQEYELDFCLDSLVPDNQHVCYPKLKSPEAVFSLTWDADADLDLHVVRNSDGRDVNAKDPLLDPIDAGKPALDAARIDRDSLRACVPDGLRQEDMVFYKPVPSGLWDIYVDLFEPCKASTVRWALTVYDATGDGVDRHLEPSYTAHGLLYAQDANGGATAGTFIAEESY